MTEYNQECHNEQEKLRQASGCDSLFNDFCYANADFYTILEARP